MVSYGAGLEKYTFPRAKRQNKNTLERAGDVVQLVGLLHGMCQALRFRSMARKKAKRTIRT